MTKQWRIPELLHIFNMNNITLRKENQKTTNGTASSKENLSSTVFSKELKSLDRKAKMILT